MLVLSTGFAWLCFSQVGRDSAKQTLLSVSLIEAWFRPAGTFLANPVAWSISCEAFFYLVFPFVIRPILRARLPVLLVAGAVLLFVEWAYWITVRGFIDPANFWIELSWYLRFPPYRLVEFLLGMVAAAALRQGWRPRVNLWFALCLVPVSVVVLWQGARHGWWQPLWSEQAFTPAFVVIVVAAAMRDLNGQRSFLRSGPMIALGGWSYSFYLVHLSVMYVMTKHVMAPAAGWANLRPILVSLLAATILAWLCYRWVEHPTERALRNLYPGRAPGASNTPSLTREAVSSQRRADLHGSVGVKEDDLR
jgi:peptidoglycan/LPS O-acetylase OafA/YrhL